MPDAVIAPLWLAANGLLGWAAWRTAGWASADANDRDRALRALMMAVATVILVGVGLGSFNVLSGLSLVATVGGVSLFATGFATLRQNRIEARETQQPKPQLLFRIWCVVWLTVSALVIGHVIVNGIWRLPTEWDSLMYHIPMIDEWLQARSLYAPESSYWWTPGNNELVGLWCVAPFSGDFFIALNNAPNICLWVLATVSIASSLGMSANWAQLAGLSVIVIHTTIHESIDASNDLAVVGWFLSAIACGLRCVHDFRQADLILCGLSLGLLAGVKYFGAGYAAAGLVIILIVLAIAHGTKRIAFAACVLTVAALPGTAWWYGRNLIVSGRPVFPMGLTSATPELAYPRIVETTFVGNADPRRFALTADALWRLSGPLQFGAPAVAPIAVAWLLMTGASRFRLKSTRSDGSCRLGIALLLIATAAVWSVTPFALEDVPETLNHLRWGYTPVRYALCFLSLATIAALLMVRSAAEAVAGYRTPWQPYRWQISAIAAAGCGTLLVWQACRVIALDRGLLVSTQVFVAAAGAFVWMFNVIVCLRTLSPKWSAGLVSTLVIGCGAFVVHSISEHWHSNWISHFNATFHTNAFTDLYEQFPYLDRMAVFDSRAYPFFGSRRQVRVSRPVYIPTYETFRTYLDERGVALLAVQVGARGAWNRYGNVPGWVAAHPDAFFPLFRGTHEDIFLYDPPPDAALVPQ